MIGKEAIQWPGKAGSFGNCQQHLFISEASLVTHVSPFGEETTLYI